MMKEILRIVAVVGILYGCLWSWQYITGIRQVVLKIDEQNRGLIEQNTLLSQALAKQCAELLGAQGYQVTKAPVQPEEPKE